MIDEDKYREMWFASLGINPHYVPKRNVNGVMDKIMSALGDKALSPCEIIEKVGGNPPSIRRAADRLVERGFLLRIKYNNRVKYAVAK